MVAGLIKRSSLAAAKHVGLTSLVADSRWRRERLLVLCYHGVSLADEHQWNPELYISPDTLARRFDSLTRTGCAVLPLDEAVRRLYAGRLPERAVTITFDDAFYDFKIRALPLLQAYGYPATVYATTERSEPNVPVVHLLSSYLFWKHRPATVDARGIDGLDRVYLLSRSAERKRIVDDLLARMRRDRMYPEEEDLLARDVMHRAGIDYDRLIDPGILRIMTRSDLAEISRHGIAVELHTHRHRTPEDPDEFIEDVRLNRLKVQAMTGRLPRHFCYPDGVHHPCYLPKLEAEGIETATTCVPDLASRQSPPLLLPRFIDNEVGSDLRFEAWATGVATWLPRRTHTAHGVH